jgi:pimeloyl-[acyl-carrier protein] methyl ester esterase
MPTPLTYSSIGQGQPLVFIHGWGLNSGVWRPLCEKLATQYQVITVDLPGFGLNVDHSISPYSLTKASKLIEQTITQPAIYIGWSLGGLIATKIAITAPEKVQALVTIASSPCFLEKKHDNAVNHWSGIKAKVLNSFHQQLAQDIEKTLDGFLKIQAMGSPHIRQDIKLLRELIMQYPIPNQQTLEQSLHLLSSEDLRTELAQITMPFLRLYGRLDSLVPKSAIKQINQLSPNSEHYIFEQASHAPFISHLDEFTQQLLCWLTNIASSK